MVGFPHRAPGEAVPTQPTPHCCSHPTASLPSRLEMQHFGVKVSIIEPGYFKTGITNAAALERTLISTWERLSKETKASYGDKYLQDCECIPKAHPAPQC